MQYIAGSTSTRAHQVPYPCHKPDSLSGSALYDPEERHIAITNVQSSTLLPLLYAYQHKTASLIATQQVNRVICHLSREPTVALQDSQDRLPCALLVLATSPKQCLSPSHFHRLQSLVRLPIRKAVHSYSRHSVLRNQSKAHRHTKYQTCHIKVPLYPSIHAEAIRFQNMSQRLRHSLHCRKRKLSVQYQPTGPYVARSPATVRAASYYSNETPFPSRHSETRLQLAISSKRRSQTGRMRMTSTPRQ